MYITITKKPNSEHIHVPGMFDRGVVVGGIVVSIAEALMKAEMQRGQNNY